MPHTISIGRGPSNDILVSQPAVSSSHALMTFAEDGKIIYTDNSTNGTTVNGKFVRHMSVYVQPGDIILLPGNYLLNWATINSRNPYSNVRQAPQPQPCYQPQYQAPVQENIQEVVYNVNPPMPPQEDKNTCGLLSLIFAIIAIVTYVPPITPLGMLFNLAAFILGIVGLFHKPIGKALAGLILSIVGPLIWLILVYVILGSVAALFVL